MNLTKEAQALLTSTYSLEDALPSRMPVYVNSIAYLFGVSALSAFATIVLSGLILALFGPDWYHASAVGHFVNSVHFWGVQVFFGAIAMHALTKFCMAAWRDGRARTWMVGIVIFALAALTALTGYLLQTNWDAQWIAVQAKDLMNATGIGAFFDPMDTGQVLTLHVSVLPLLVAGLIGIHLALVRRDGPVKPIDRGASPAEDAGEGGRNE